LLLRQIGTPAASFRDAAPQWKALPEKRIKSMFVTISMYQARAGEEDAIIALHEDWQRTLRPKAKGYLSGELLRNVENAHEFLSIMRFESQQAAELLVNEPEHNGWYHRLVSLTEGRTVTTRYTCEWL
jgi:heme-degrading monooxygenase HmoA